MTLTSLPGLGSGGVSLLTNAIRCPSGAQTGSETAFSRSVTRRASPPPTGISQRCGVSVSRLERKASRAPFGDHRGDVSRLAPAVSWTGAPPPTGTLQIAER